MTSFGYNYQNALRQAVVFSVSLVRDTRLQRNVNSYLHLTNDSYITSNETNKETIDGSKIIAKQQPTNHYNFHVLTTNHMTTKLTYQYQDQRHLNTIVS